MGRSSQILADCAKDHMVTIQDILGRRQHREVSNARKDAARRMYESGMTYMQIANVIGRSYWTVRYLIRTKQ